MRNILRSFRGVLVLTVVLVHAVVTPILFVSILQFVEQGYQSQFIDKARAMSNLLATQISEYDIDNDPNSVRNFLDDLMLGGQLSFIEIIPQQGTAITPGTGQITDSVFVEDFYFGQHEDHVYFVSMPMNLVDNGESANIHFGFDEIPVQEQIDSAQWRGAYVAVAYLLLMITIMTFVSGRLSRSLGQLRTAANKISAGETHNTLRINSNISDFSSLAQDLENMRYNLVRQKQMVKRREVFIRAIMNNMTEGMMLIDESLQVDSLNPAVEKAFGYTDEEIVGHSVSNLFDADIRHNLDELLCKYRDDRVSPEDEGLNQEWLAKRKNGESFYVELGLSRIVLDDNTLIICNLHDITLRKKTENALIEARQDAEEANQAKSMFLSTMSHELRTPLNAVIGYSEILMDDAQDRGDVTAITDLEKIRSSGRHLLSLINNVLDLSKIEAGKMELHLSSFDLQKLLDEAINSTKPLIEKNGNQLEFEFNCEHSHVYLDETKTRQVVINLLSNAAKFTSHGVVRLEVTCIAYRQDYWINIAVTDSGIGIPRDRMGRLFENFSQVDAEVTTKYGGTGLGLSISRKFCQMMGGDIEVVSTENQGSTFTVKLPLKSHTQGRAISA